MYLTEPQKEALSKTPLFRTRGEVNLNRIVWVDNVHTKDFRLSTIAALMKKGLLRFKVGLDGFDQTDEVVLTDKAKRLGYKSTI